MSTVLLLLKRERGKLTRAPGGLVAAERRLATRTTLVMAQGTPEQRQVAQGITDGRRSNDRAGTDLSMSVSADGFIAPRGDPAARLRWINGARDVRLKTSDGLIRRAWFVPEHEC